jgi:hypothetical protein
MRSLPRDAIPAAHEASRQIDAAHIELELVIRERHELRFDNLGRAGARAAAVSPAREVSALPGASSSIREVATTFRSLRRASSSRACRRTRDLSRLSPHRGPETIPRQVRAEPSRLRPA